MRKSLLVLIVIILFDTTSYAQDSTRIPDYNLLQIYTPGATHFKDGNIGKGMFYASSEIGLLTYGLLSQSTLKKEDFTLNAPLVIAQQVYVMDKLDTFYPIVSNRLSNTLEGSDFQSYGELAKAPFEWRTITKPFVLSLMAFGIGNALISDQSIDVGDIKSVEGYGMNLNKYTGTGVYNTFGALLSYGAGMTEEIMFRGMLQPGMEARYGPGKALIYSSLLFSAAHIPNYILTKNPYERLYYIFAVTTAGFIFGKNAQNQKYNLKQAIAAHAWYDFTLILTSWLVNPEKNYFGFDVRYQF